MEKIKVNNVPQYAYEYKYVAVVMVSGERWFFGAYNNDQELPNEFYERDMELIALDKVEAI